MQFERLPSEREPFKLNCLPVLLEHSRKKQGYSREISNMDVVLVFVSTPTQGGPQMQRCSECGSCLKTADSMPGGQILLAPSR